MKTTNKVHHINWNTTLAENELIFSIAERAVSLMPAYSRLETLMDISACHLNGCPLKLQELLNADEFNFIHDVAGIRQHIDRRTGKLTGLFEPRFADNGRRS